MRAGTGIVGKRNRETGSAVQRPIRRACCAFARSVPVMPALRKLFDVGRLPLLLAWLYKPVPARTWRAAVSGGGVRGSRHIPEVQKRPAAEAPRSNPPRQHRDARSAGGHLLSASADLAAGS